MTFRKDLRENCKPKIGAWVTLGHPAIAEIFCRSSVDWVCVDLEHTSISMEQAELLIRTIALYDKTPLVRLSSNDSVQIKRVMDMGAHGIIVPNVKSRDELLQAYQAMHYPPKGFRGVGLARAQGYGDSFQEYKNWINEEAILIAQIEHIDAVKNIDSIFESPELDAFIIGPYDLSGSLGKPGDIDGKDVQDALEAINTAGKKHDVAGGIHIVEPDIQSLKSELAKGYRFIAYSVDIRILDSQMKCLNQLKQENLS